LRLLLFSLFPWAHYPQHKSPTSYSVLGCDSSCFPPTLLQTFKEHRDGSKITAAASKPVRTSQNQRILATPNKVPAACRYQQTAQWLSPMRHYVRRPRFAQRELLKISHNTPNPSLPARRHIAFPDRGHRELQVCGAATVRGDIPWQRRGGPVTAGVGLIRSSSLAHSMVGSCDMCCFLSFFSLHQRFIYRISKVFFLLPHGPIPNVYYIQRISNVLYHFRPDCCRHNIARCLPPPVFAV
jgi:hypothetical protein